MRVLYIVHIPDNVDSTTNSLMRYPQTAMTMVEKNFE